MSNKMIDREKLIEAILYVAHRVNDPTKMRIAKVLYLADLAHLSQYGRFITRDDYYAMKDGPVPSKTYDIIKEKQDLTEIGLEQENFQVRGWKIIPLRDANFDKFSESDLIHLDIVIKKYGNLPIRQLRDLSHLGAWDNLTNKGEKLKGESVPKSIPMSLESIIEMLPNEDELRLHLTKEGHL